MQNLTNLAFAFYSTGGFTPVENAQMAASVVQAAVESFGEQSVRQVEQLIGSDCGTWAAALTYTSAYFARFGDCDRSIDPKSYRANLGSNATEVLAYMALWAQE